MWQVLAVSAGGRSSVVEHFLEFHARPRRRSRLRPKGRWNRGKASLSPGKAAHVRLVFFNPSGHLLLGKPSGLWQPGPLRAEPCTKKQHQLLLLLRGQCVGCSLDFIKFAHRWSLPRRPSPGKGRLQGFRATLGGRFRGYALASQTAFSPQYRPGPPADAGTPQGLPLSCHRLRIQAIKPALFASWITAEGAPPASTTTMSL